MAVRIATVRSGAVIGSPTDASEKIVVSAGPINLITDTAEVLFFWWLVLTIGTSGTAVTLRLRRGSTTADTLVVSQSPCTVTAGNQYSFSGSFVDTPQAGAGVNYGVGVSVTGAAATSTVNEAFLVAMVL